MITDAAQIKNVMLSGYFKLETNGYSSVFFQKVKLPKEKSETVKYGGAGQTVSRKQAVDEEIETITAEIICSAEGSDRVFFQKWRDDRRTRDTAKYYRDATLIMLGPNDEPSMIWDIQDMWLKEQEWEEFDGEDKKKMLKGKLTFECNDINLRAK
jgi:hypothetical protein